MQKVNEFSEFYKKNSTCKKTMKMKLKLTKMIFRYLLSLSDYAKKKIDEISQYDWFYFEILRESAK